MSARDDLIALIEGKCRAIGHEPDIHVDAFAHELAEKQRVYAWGKRQSFQNEHADGAIAAANLIDPEVTS